MKEQKISIELTMNDLMILRFALRKAIHYTEWFDPTYFQYMELPDKKQHLSDYKKMLLKIQTIDGYFTYHYKEDDPEFSDLEKPLNARLVDEIDNDNDGKDK